MERAAREGRPFFMDAIQIEERIDPNVVLNARIDLIELNLLNISLALTRVMEAHRDLLLSLTLASVQPKEGERAN